jgi:hypothetical protein
MESILITFAQHKSPRRAISNPSVGADGGDEGGGRELSEKMSPRPVGNTVAYEIGSPPASAGATVPVKSGLVTVTSIRELPENRRWRPIFTTLIVP